MADAKVSSGRLLVVDDDPLICTLLEKSLSREGYEIAVANSGEAALEQARIKKPDLIILDVLLPHMNGYETFQALTSSACSPEVPIIFLTSKNDPEDLARGLELGAADYIVKPFKPAELAVRIKARLKFARQVVSETMPMPVVHPPEAPVLLPLGEKPNWDDRAAKLLIAGGLINTSDLEKAKGRTTTSLGRPTKISLLEALVQTGAITSSQRQSAERKLKAIEEGGTQQLGNYKLLKKLGEGGMGAIFAAQDTLNGRKVALKVLAARFNDDIEFVARFRREGEAMQQLHHPNIAEAYGVGEDIGLHYFAMELCEGEALDEFLAREGSMPWQKAVAVIAQAARGLQHAHERGVLHRDIKPGNLYLMTSGMVKVLDFGLLKKFEQAEQSVNTRTGTTLGTPDYIAPEQARGDREVDGRLDIYSLGATFFHLVTGSTPYGGGSPALVLMRHLSDKVPDPRKFKPELPESVAKIIMKMMEKDPIDRFIDCADLYRQLTKLIGTS